MDSTCWTLVHKAAAGDRPARESFGVRYAPVIRAYLTARWRGSPCAGDLDDAIQEAFVECIRTGGVLERAQDDRPGGFRAFLYGAVRNVALRFEERRARRNAQAPAGNGGTRRVARARRDAFPGVRPRAGPLDHARGG